MTKKTFFIFIFFIFINNLFASETASSLKVGDSYSYDDSSDIKNIKVTDDLLGDGKKEKVVFYRNSENNSYVVVVDLSSNIVVANQRIADDLDDSPCYGQSPSGVYQFDENSPRKFIVSVCEKGPSIGLAMSVYSWDGKLMKRMAAPWKIMGGMASVKIEKSSSSQVDHILVSYMGEPSDLYVLNSNKFVLRNDLKTPSDDSDSSISENSPTAKVLKEIKEKIGTNNNSDAISGAKQWISENETKGSQLSLNKSLAAGEFHFALAKALQTQGDEESALDEYSKYFKSIGQNNEDIVNFGKYEKLGDFYWHLGDMDKAKLSYGKAIDVLQAMNAGNPKYGKDLIERELKKTDVKIKEINETTLND
jgi:hypothetical protein